jgi:AcrR family transcriptional regulator
MSDLRSDILEQARHLLVADGYADLSMRKIAGAVGCSATSIYLHFENKDALVHALIDDGFERLNARLHEAAGLYDEAGARLEALARAYVDFGISNPEYYEVMFQLHPARMARYPAEAYRRARRNLELLGQAVAEGNAAGTFAAQDPELAAHVLWASMHGVVSLLLAQRVDVRLDLDILVNTAIRHALDGFRNGVPAN